LAVQRKYKREGEADCDFISCVAFGNNGEFVEKYLRKGMKIAVVGHIQTGSYINKDGVKIYTTDVVVEEHEFCESKSISNGEIGNNVGYADDRQTNSMNDGFMHIPDGIDDELPFI
jgi:single-strand DNA-binding protein